jgi:hypothetical protein
MYLFTYGLFNIINICLDWVPNTVCAGELWTINRKEKTIEKLWNTGKDFVK